MAATASSIRWSSGATLNALNWPWMTSISPREHPIHNRLI